MLLPAQNVVGPDGVIVGMSGVPTETVTELETALHPFASVAVTEYTPEDVTVMLELRELFDHKYVFPPPATIVTPPPWQNIVGPVGLAVALGNG